MLIRLFLLLVVARGSVFAQNDPSWSEPFPAFKIVGSFRTKGFVAEFVDIGRGRTEISFSIFGAKSDERSTAVELVSLARILVGRIRA